MKAPLHHLLFVLFVSLFFFSSCEKDEIPAPEEIVEKPCWQRHAEIELDRRLLIKSFTTDDAIYLLSHNYFLKMDENGLLEDYFISETGNLSIYDDPMLNEKLFAVGIDVYNIAELEIFSTQNPAISTSIDLLAIDSNFLKINYFSGNGMCANDSEKLLFSVHKKFIQGNPEPYLYFWMFDFELENDHLDIEFDQEIKIEIPGTGNALGEKSLTEMFVFEDEFYCSISGPVATYKINSQGEYEELFSMRDTRVFSQNDTLFALGHDWRCTIGYSIKPPQTNSWESFSMGIYDGCWGKFYQIDQRFILVNGRKFWELEINHSNTTFEFKELNGNCLPNSTISGLFEFKGKVYILTLDGLYFIDQADFFTYKEE